MSSDKMQASRFEMKYVISEDKALRVRDYVRSFLELDENCCGHGDYSYPVHSVYFDSDLMKTYWDTINGNKNRFKLRVRFYNDDPETPVFLEIKRRMDNCIMKQRAGVRREAVYMIMNGQLPPPDLMVNPTPKSLVAMQNFWRSVQELEAKPKLHVFYRREAYMPLVDNSARLTMDRLVQTEPDPTARMCTTMHKPMLVWGHAVVLELKFTDRYPKWFRDLVCTFDLKQCGAAKYADGVALLNGRLPRHRHMPAPNADLFWPVPDDRPPMVHIDSGKKTSTQNLNCIMPAKLRLASTSGSIGKPRKP